MSSIGAKRLTYEEWLALPETKLEDYRQTGVHECWLVSPEAETIEVLRLATEETTTEGIFGIDGTLRSEVLGEFTVPVSEIFR